MRRRQLWFTVAFVGLVVAAITVISVSLFVDLPLGLVAAAYGFFVVCALAVAVMTFRDSRAAGTGFFRSLGRGIREMFSLMLS